MDGKILRTDLVMRVNGNTCR